MNSCKRKLLYSNNRMKIILHVVNLPTMSKCQLHFSSKKKKRKEKKIKMKKEEKNITIVLSSDKSITIILDFKHLSIEKLQKTNRKITKCIFSLRS